MIVRGRGWVGAFLALALCACETRAIPSRDPVFADVAPLLERACASCHSGPDAEAGWRVDAYLDTIRCPEGAAIAVEPPDDTAPILSALDTPTHAGLLDDTERALLAAWVSSGAAARVGAAHPAGWVDPRSPDFHGLALRAARWAPMLDSDSPGACARCHEGAGADAGTSAAPGATACISCHRDDDGPLACSTCHGTPGRPYPPRDLCFHPDESGTAGAHAAHVGAGIVCAVCHGARAAEGLGETLHGDGIVQVMLLPAVAGADAAWDPSSRTCTMTCHARGGATPVVQWDTPLDLDCNSCHLAPPADHFAGPCSGCHAEANADGTALRPGPLHANGMVDLGDGSGGCGACHGSGDDPSPLTGSHPRHHAPAFTGPLACEECHQVPTTPLDDGHFDTTLGAEVTFGALASARGASPSIDSAGRCSDVACHGAGIGGGTILEPVWGVAGAGACGACHGLPPPAPHTSSLSCSTVACHGGYATPGPGLSAEGIAVHVNGRVDLWPTP